MRPRPRQQPGRQLLHGANPTRGPEAVDGVVVDEPGGLHQRVADGRADEAEAAPLQLLAHRLRFVGLRRQLGKLPPAADERLAADERPQQRREALLLAQLDDAARVLDRALDLEPVPDDARVGEQALQSRSSNRATASGSKPANARR
jgi:hypothetical protein